jgi:hypothetical protein
VEVVELGAHERAQDAAAPVGRVRADDGDAGGAHGPAGHGQLDREGACAADDAAVRARCVHALEREVPREALHALPRRLHPEVLADGEHRLRELVEVGGRADAKAHRSSPDPRSRAPRERPPARPVAIVAVGRETGPGHLIRSSPGVRTRP